MAFLRSLVTHLRPRSRPTADPPPERPDRIVCARYENGPTVPSALELVGEQPWSFRERGAPEPIAWHAFAIDWQDGNGNILFHFNPRPDEDAVVLSSYLGGEWQEQTRIESYPFTRDPDVPFGLRIEVLPDRFGVSVDGRPLCEFPHRSPPEAIREVSTSLL